MVFGQEIDTAEGGKNTETYFVYLIANHLSKLNFTACLYMRLIQFFTITNEILKNIGLLY